MIWQRTDVEDTGNQVGSCYYSRLLEEIHLAEEDMAIDSDIVIAWGLLQKDDLVMERGGGYGA